MRGNGDNQHLSLSGTTSDTDLQGVGGGGDIANGYNVNESSAYDNPGFTSSATTIQQSNLELKGSSEFILVGDNDQSALDCIKNTAPWIKKKVKSAFTRKMLYRRLPILTWLPKYNTSYAVGDLVAGVTVGLTVIPQSLAYSNIAGLPSQYGLYGSFLGCFIYIFLGSCKDVPFGPTAIASLLTYQAVNGKGPEYAILLCFLSGIIELVMGIFGLGFIIDFVSGPVSSGFTSAVALIIVTSQVKDILAISVTGTTFVEMWIDIFKNIHNTRAWDTILGVCCIAVLLIMRIIAAIKIGPEDDQIDEPTLFQRIVNKTLWLIGTSRNAILVVVCGFLGYMFQVDDVPLFRLIGEIPPGLPSVQVPPFSVNTINETASFVEMVSSLGSGIMVVPLIALLENIAICKAFANGKSVDATQELLAIGVANIANSFVQSFPGTGSLSRSAVNNCSGVRTPLGGLYTGLLVLVALLFFTPYFYYIPKSSLAAIIIAAVVFMVEVRVIKPMWRTKKSDLIPGMVTFVACLVLPLEIGIMVGIGVNLLFILYHAARPKITVERLLSRSGVEYLMLTPDRCLIFPSVDYVRNLVTKYSLKEAAPVVIDCSHVYGADYTAATVVETLTKDFAARDQPLFFYNLKPSVSSVFEGLSPKEFIVCYTEEDLDSLLKDKSYFKPKEIFIAA